MTVTLYVPAFTVGTDAPLLQPESIVPNDSITPIPNIARKSLCLRRLKKAPSRAAKLAAEAGASHGLGERFNSVRAPVLLTTKVAVELSLAVSETLPGLIEQDPLDGMPEQESVTAPLNVAFAVRFNVTTPVAPSVTDSAAGVPKSVKAGESAVTVIVDVVEVAGLKLPSPE